MHVAPRHDGPPPASALPYTAANVDVVTVPAAGGEEPAAKLGLVAAVPRWAATLRRAIRDAEALHVRCPANLSGLALAMLRVRRDQRPCWVKYAGNWRPPGPEPWSYRLQRRWLRKGFGRIAVTVNGEGDDDPPHVRAFPNPSLTDDDLARGAEAAAAKPDPADGLRLAFVGRVEAEKGAPSAVRAAVLLAADTPVHLDVVGDGPARAECEALVAGTAVDARFHGWVDRTAVHDVLAGAHALLLPSTASEGWPKVLSEAMAFGAVPVTSGVSSVPQVLGRAEAGVVLPATDPDTVAAAVRSLLAGDRLAELRARGLDAARPFTFAAYLELVDRLFADHWGIVLSP